MSAPPALTTHELLLALAGRVDDDLLGIGRELAAIGEDPQAVELLAAALVADRAVLPPWIREAVVAAARSRHVEIDVEGGLPAAVAEDRTAHRFQADALPAGLITDTVRRVPPRNLAGCTIRLTWRLTPAGAAPGPLPHPVLLVELPGPSTSAEVLAYRLSSVLDRAGMPSSVEAYGAADALPAYHVEALRNARTIVDGGSGRPVPRPPVERGAVAAPVTAPVETVDPTELISSGPLFTAPIPAEPVTAVLAGADAPEPARESADREAPSLLSGAPVVEPGVAAPSAAAPEDIAAREESRAEETTAIPVAGRQAPASPAAEAPPARPDSRAAEAEAASAATPAAGFRSQDAAEVTARFPQRSRASSRPDTPIRAVPDPVPGEAGPTPAAAELPPRSPAIGQLPRLPEELDSASARPGSPSGRDGAAPRGLRTPVPGRDEQAEISGPPDIGPQALPSRTPRPAPGPRIGPPLSVVPPAPERHGARPEPESRADDVDALGGPLDRPLLEPPLEPADESAPPVAPGPAPAPGAREPGARAASWAADWASGEWAMPDGGRRRADVPAPAEAPAAAEPVPSAAEPAVPEPECPAAQAPADDVPADDDQAVDNAEDHGVPDDAPYGRRAAVDGNPTLRPLPDGRRRARHRSDVTDTTPQGLPAPRPVPRLSSRGGPGRPEDAAPRPAEQVDAPAADLSEAPAQDVLFGGSSADDRPAAGHRADAPDRPRRAAEPDHLFGPLTGSEPEADAGDMDPGASWPGLEGPAGTRPDPARPEHTDPDHRDHRHDDHRHNDHRPDDHRGAEAPGPLGEEHGGEPPAPESRRRREPESERPDFDRPAYDRSAFSRPAFGGPPPGEAPGSLFGESSERPPGAGRSRRSWTGQHGPRHVGRDRVGDDGPGGDTFGGERFGGEEFGGERFGGEEFGGDRFGAENPGDRPRNTSPDRTRPGGAGPRESRPDPSGEPAASTGPGGHADLRSPVSDGPVAEPNGAGPGGHAEGRTPDPEFPAGTGPGESRRATPDAPRTEGPAGPGPGEFRRNTPDAPPTDGRGGTPWPADPADTRQDTAPAAPRPAPGEEPSAEALAALSGRERELLRRLQEELASRERPPARDTGPYPGPSRQGARPQQAHPGPEAGQNGHRNGHAQGHPLGPPDIA
jgi:hypothetical protein